ncbi:MAG: hypothetical protein KDH20_15780 [Rhodocyclaceae bacterium]|nr:hypothetical protein [Rhodocyclaceae bacterium]
MAVTQADIDALTAALASGERSVRMPSGAMVEYRSVAEIRTARDELKAEMADQNAEAGTGPRRVRQVRYYHGGRGY